MKTTYKFYFLFHILLISISSIYLVFTGYLDFKNLLDNKNKAIIYYDNIINNTIFNEYKKISGTNTGYGFYGINVATEAYFLVQVYNNKNKLIYSTTTQNIYRKNTLSRFMVLSCSELNSDYEIEKENKQNLKSNQKTQPSIKEKYSNKIFKYIGLHTIKEFDKDYFYYTVTLYCLNPKNIWNSKNTKNDITKAKIKEVKFFKQ
jgi:hypothetical protein